MKRSSIIYFTGIYLLLFCLSVLAANEKEYALERNSYEVLTSARELMQEKKYTDAINKLKQLLAEDIKPYDEAVTYQTLAYVYISMDDYPSAIDSFTQSLDGGQLPDNVVHQINYTMAQLLIQEERVKEGIQYLERWLQNETNPDKQAYLLAASAYYQLERYDEMIPMLKKAIAASDKADQSLYEMLLAGYYQTGNFREAAATLENLIKLFPEKDDYWLQLAASYHRLEQYDKSLAIYEIAHTRGILDKEDILRLAQLYLNQSLPYKAGKLLEEKMQKGVLEENVDNLELLANSWLLAKEYKKAIPALKELANRKNDPLIYYRIGRLSFEQENWEEAVNAFERALNNNLESNVAESYLLMGIAAFNSNNDSLSSRALTEASGFDRTREQARWWLEKLGRKMEKQAGNS